MSNEKETTTVLPASTSLRRETAADPGSRSSTRAAAPLTLAVGKGSKARGVFEGSSVSKDPAPREWTEACGAPEARFHHALSGTASGTNVQVALPLPRVFREGSSTWNTTGSSGAAILSWNDTLPAPVATCGIPPWESRIAKAGRRRRARSGRRGSRGVPGLTG